MQSMKQTLIEKFSPIKKCLSSKAMNMGSITNSWILQTLPIDSSDYYSLSRPGFTDPEDKTALSMSDGITSDVSDNQRINLRNS